jgi:glucose-1-phosphate adenylyltransferase
VTDLPPLNLYDPEWRIHTRSEERPPAKIMEHSRVTRALLSNGCIVIRGTVEHSVLSPGVVVHEGAVVRNSIIMTDTVIGAGAQLDNCIVDKHVVIGPGAVLGYGDDYSSNWLEPSRLSTGLTLVGIHARVKAGVRIGRNVLVGPEVREADFTTLEVASGDTIDPRMPVWE